MLSGKVALLGHYIMKLYGGMEVRPHSFYISALGEGEWQSSHSSHFTSSPSLVKEFLVLIDWETGLGLELGIVVNGNVLVHAGNCILLSTF